MAITEGPVFLTARLQNDSLTVSVHSGVEFEFEGTKLTAMSSIEVPSKELVEVRNILLEITNGGYGEEARQKAMLDAAENLKTLIRESDRANRHPEEFEKDASGRRILKSVLEGGVAPTGQGVS